MLLQVKKKPAVENHNQIQNRINSKIMTKARVDFLLDAFAHTLLLCTYFVVLVVLQ